VYWFFDIFSHNQACLFLRIFEGCCFGCFLCIVFYSQWFVWTHTTVVIDFYCCFGAIVVAHIVFDIFHLKYSLDFLGLFWFYSRFYAIFIHLPLYFSGTVLQILAVLPLMYTYRFISFTIKFYSLIFSFLVL
jgi:hypothetical protein